jgi:tRNA(fMet)-specific endonuclease VapC
MKRFLLDTNMASHYINRRHGVYDRARAEAAKGNSIGIAIPVLVELAAGAERSASRDRNMKALLISLNSWKIWPMVKPAALEYGRIDAMLARIGRPIGTIDMMIAAVVVTLPNCVLVSSDGDFRSVPGLKVEDWRS